MNLLTHAPYYILDIMQKMLLMLQLLMDTIARDCFILIGDGMAFMMGIII